MKPKRRPIVRLLALAIMLSGIAIVAGSGWVCMHWAAGVSEFRDAHPDSRAASRFWRAMYVCGDLSSVILEAVGGTLSRLSYDLPFLFAPEQTFADVIVVERDQKSYDELEQRYDQKWDRSLYIRLLNKLTADGAKLVVLDILLDDPGTEETDDLLAGVIRTNGNVILAANYQEFTGLSGGQPSFPLDQFRKSAKGIGLSLIYFDPADRGAAREHLHLVQRHDARVASRAPAAGAPRSRRRVPCRDVVSRHGRPAGDAARARSPDRGPRGNCVHLGGRRLDHAAAPSVVCPTARRVAWPIRTSRHQCRSAYPRDRYRLTP